MSEIFEKSKEKRVARNNRRFIIKPGNLRDEVILTDITQDKVNFIYAVIYISDDFV